MNAPRTLICGSLAYDTIMVFPDRFARHILPDQVHMLSVSFQIGEMRREWGGCAGNIAYSLKGLGGQPVVMATLGDDGAPYCERFEKLAIAPDGVRTVAGTYTAQAFIITDLDDNQITAFHPGAMNRSHDNRVGDVEGIALGIVAPDGKDGMRAHVEQFAAAKIPFVFDPGQGLPLFSSDELVQMIDAANYLAVNDYEAKLLSERTGMSEKELAARVEAMVVTLGAEGSRIHAGGDTLSVPTVAPGGAGRSDRLRRRVSRRAAVRHRSQVGLGAHRPPRVGDGRAQDRVARRTEPQRQPGRNRDVILRRIRQASLVRQA